MQYKKTIFILFTISILFLPVNALIAGNNNTITTIDKCNNLYVNVTGVLPIEPSEYNFLQCELIDNNSWYCDCHDNYNLDIELNLRAYNNYTFNIKYDYEITTTRSGGGRITIIYGDMENKSKINNTNIELNNTSDDLININISPDIDVELEHNITTGNDVKDSKDKDKTNNKKIFILTTIIFFTIVFFVLLPLYLSR